MIATTIGTITIDAVTTAPTMNMIGEREDTATAIDAGGRGLRSEDETVVAITLLRDLRPP